MRKYLTSHIEILPLILLAFTTIVNAADWEVRRDELLKQAENEYNKVLKERVSPEKIAQDNGMPYPVLPPNMNKLMVQTETMKRAKALADDEFNKEHETKEILKLYEQYKPFKVNDVITIELKIKFNEVVTGKLHSFNKDYAKIGNRVVKMSDLQDDDRDRFFVASCEALQERKIADLKRKLEAQKAMFQEAKLNELLPKALLENGYYPIKRDENAKGYLELDNWKSMKEIFNEKLEDARKLVGEDLHEEIVDSLMKKNGFVYNAVKGQWIPIEEQSQKDDKPGLFGKLKKIFGN